MKKLLTITFSLFIATASIFAQTDVTSKYIVNPSFETNGSSGWNVADLWSQTNNSFQKHGNTYFEKWVATGNSVGSGSASQVITELQPGKYTLIARAQNLDQGNLEKSCTGVTIYAGNNSTTVYGAKDYTVDFTTFDSAIEIGFRANNATGNWIAVDNFRLIYNGAPSITETRKQLNPIISDANKLYGKGDGVNAAALKDALDKAESVMNYEVKDEDALTAYLNLKEQVAEYKIMNASESNPLDYTYLISNPSFEVNGADGWTLKELWSQGNNEFSPKAGGTYFEKWVSKGNRVGSGSVTQTIYNIPNGKYKLVVGAQNVNQNNLSQQCSGVYVFAGDKKTTVYGAKDYNVYFESIAGSVEIGYVAENASGNWIAVDNFRLYYIGSISTSDVVAEIQRIVSNAQALQQKMMSSTAASNLENAISAGNSITVTSTSNEVQDAKIKLDKAIEQANISIAEYAALEAEIASVEKNYSSTKKGAEELKSAIDHAKDMAINAKATSNELATEITNLEKALLAFRIANGTTGFGTVKVTSTNKYVPTGATEALMRATMSGVSSNILEKGVCWSTNHEPTVLDNRTAEYHSLNGEIFHVRGLKPATVYYLRPYIISKTYQVAYGDEVKIVTHPQGTCTWSWNEGAPTADANTRCRNAIEQTIDYFNEWTGIKGFHLSGNYGSGTPTADCSYGGWMRIGPNAAYQAIGTVIHETGHGVGVGTQAKWKDATLHDWVWKGREANTMYHFLENQYDNPEYVMVGDGTHGWGQKATYDWFVNGADKDKHTELQYIGGCMLLYSLFIDGLCPTSSYKNGLAGYTYNFDAEKKYYIRSESADRGLNDGFLFQNSTSTVGWKPMTEAEAREKNNNAAWYIEYDANSGYYRFKNASTGKYLSHAGTSVTTVTRSTPYSTENFQLMPGRPDAVVTSSGKDMKTYGYWFTWENNGSKAMELNAYSNALKYGTNTVKSFDFTDNATAQRYIIFAEDELSDYVAPTPILVGDANDDDIIDVSDAVFLVNSIIDGTAKQLDLKVCDVNNNGTIDYEDAIEVLKLYINNVNKQ